MKTALITGTSKGIGKATAELLLQGGWRVYGISRSQPEISHENFKWLEFDLMTFGRYPELSTLITKDLDLLVNNAGIAYKVPIEKVLELDLDKQWKMNVKAPIMLIRTLLTKLAKGRIINISSIASLIDYEDVGIYAMTKAALNKFATQFALESSIPIASILPRIVDTPMTHTLDPGDDSTNYLQPKEVAEVIIKLAEEDFQSGSEIIVASNHLPVDLEAVNEHSLRKVVNVDDLI